MDFIMCNENDGDIAKFLYLADGFQHFHLLFLAERRSRLVEDQHLRAKIDCPGDGKRLALAAGHRTHGLVRIGDVNADLGHLLGRDAVHLAHLQQAEGAGEMGYLAPKEEIARHRCQRIQGKVLIDSADAGIGCIARRGERDRPALDDDLAVGGLEHTREDFDQGRFAGAVVTEKCMHLARIDSQVHPVQRGEGAELLHQPPGLDKRCCCVISHIRAYP